MKITREILVLEEPGKVRRLPCFSFSTTLFLLGGARTWLSAACLINERIK